MKVEFSNNVQTTSVGRNGAIKTTGVFVSAVNFAPDPNRHVMSLSPCTSRGYMANCDIDVPMADVPDFIQALQDMLANYHHSQELKALV
ncbi:hypothetical protein [Hymenobacter siberiensis]|uniref:hypothetical protein n=1 Tax=Hymenobacter siberiensis TaxID=2848396 RepID=UPI001C1DD48A|nr:hypothetical protein [Hymenobacter siberiensis]